MTPHRRTTKPEQQQGTDSNYQPRVHGPSTRNTPLTNKLTRKRQNKPQDPDNQNKQRR